MSILRQPSKGEYVEMAAAGTTQATAAELTADRVMVTTITEASAEGVILPLGNLNDEVFIINGHATANLFIWPRSGGKLNNASADSNLTLPPNRAAHFRGINDKNWAVIF
jgi:hypothetical protein